MTNLIERKDYTVFSISNKPLPIFAIRTKRFRRQAIFCHVKTAPYSKFTLILIIAEVHKMGAVFCVIYNTNFEVVYKWQIANVFSFAITHNAKFLLV